MKRLVYLSAVVMMLVMGCMTNGRADEVVNITFTGVNGASQDGVYVSPYYATIDGKKNVAIYCDDFLHEVNWNESWQATVSRFSDLSNARFQAGSVAETRHNYEEIGWLIDQLALNPSSQWGNINFALWAVNDPSLKSLSDFTTNSTSWLENAQSQPLNLNEFKDFAVLTPIHSGPGSPQEMLTLMPTPEPASLALFGTGLLALGSLVKRKIGK